jgi:hypothetical protein
MLNLKKLLYACVAINVLGNIAMADYKLPAVPKKFQGAWVCSGGPLTIGANTVSHGGPKDSLKLISIEPGDEELDTVIVKWSTNPGVNVIAMVWKLVKLNGQQALMDINYESPTSATLCLKR